MSISASALASASSTPVPFLASSSRPVAYSIADQAELQRGPVLAKHGHRQSVIARSHAVGHYWPALRGVIESARSASRWNAPMDDPQQESLTLLFTDIENSTRHLQRL